jgi:hypothetical protein
LDMGIKGSNNEPQGTKKWHEKSVRMGIMQHDKDDGDINDTIGVTATFVYAGSPRSRPLSTTQSAACIALLGYAA